MTSELTRESIEWLNYAATGLAANGTEMAMSPQDVIALTESCLATMDSEPVAEIRAYYPLGIDGGKQKFVQVTGELPDFGAQLYAIQQPAPEREHVRREHAEWSQATFGNVGPIGPLKHLSKEALEAAAEPDDLSEWADMQFLMWDAQRRAGITDEQITQAMIEKLAVNKQREWPEPKDGEPRLHIKEQVAAVVLDERAAFNAWNNEDNLPIAGVGAKNAAWLAWQARAMLQAQSDDDGEPTDDERIMAIEGMIECLRCGDNGWVVGEMGITRCACGQAGNSPVNDVTNGKPLTIILPDITSKAFWSGTGKTEIFHPETYCRWVKEVIERYCAIARIDVEVK